MLDYDGDANIAELTRSYYHLNALGSVMEITDANQAGVVSYRYTPYGEVTITRGGVAQGADPLGQYWGYTGRFSDEETELWYYRARYYDGATGRFLQRDSASYAAGPNLYCYVDSRPIARGDASGLGPDRVYTDEEIKAEIKKSMQEYANSPKPHPRWEDVFPEDKPKPSPTPKRPQPPPLPPSNEPGGIQIGKTRFWVLPPDSKGTDITGRGHGWVFGITIVRW